METQLPGSDQVASHVLPLQAEEGARKGTKGTQAVGTVGLTVLGHVRDLQGSHTDIVTFGYKWTEQNYFNFFPRYLVIDLV